MKSRAQCLKNLALFLGADLRSYTSGSKPSWKNCHKHLVINRALFRELSKRHCTTYAIEAATLSYISPINECIYKTDNCPTFPIAMIKNAGYITLITTIRFFTPSFKNTAFWNLLGTQISSRWVFISCTQPCGTEVVSNIHRPEVGTCVTCHVSHVTRHVWRVTRHMSHVTCHMLHVTFYMLHVTCNVSHVTRHM